MAILDIILLLCFIPAIVTGISKGFVKQVIDLVAILAAAWAAFHFSKMIGEWLGQYLTLDPSILNVVSFVLVAIVVALLLAILTCCLLNLSQWRSILPAVSAGANGSLTAIMNTSCAVGFGSVIKIVPGFALLTQLLVGSGASPLSLLVSEAAAVNVLAGATGSASGGLSIALDALGSQYLAMANAIGLDPAYLHRIASISAGGLDTLPHNGGILTVLAFSHCTHKESYRDILISLTLIPAAGSILIAVIWGLLL